MTTPRIGTIPRTIVFALGLSAFLAPFQGTARASTPSELLFERTLMDQAGAKCRLFSPDIAAALAAAEAEARGAALRGGASDQSTRAVQDRAALKAAATPCASSDLAIAANRVRRAFDGYAQLKSMSFPGASTAWEADRHPWPAVVKGKAVAGPRWRLSETGAIGGERLTMGVASGPELIALATRADAGSLSGARLVFRDPAKAAEPFLDPRRVDLAAKMPDAFLTQVFLASGLTSAAPTLLPAGARGGVMAIFPARAAEALASLDPREAMRVDFVYASRSGERVESGYMEVGDFAAGRAFLAAGR